MKHISSFLISVVVAAGAWVQPVASQGVEPIQTAFEKRRAELRSALQAQFEHEAQNKVPGPENTSLKRQLSVQERADLRRQLHRQYRDAQPDRP
jgi:LPS sulfotransferase NodH